MRRWWAVALLASFSCSSPQDTGDELSQSEPLDGLLPLEAIRMYAEADKARAGEAADLDGDGVREVTSFKGPDGTRRWESDADQDGRAEWFVEERTDGTVSSGVDRNDNGKWDYLQEYRIESRASCATTSTWTAASSAGAASSTTLPWAQFR